MRLRYFFWIIAMLITPSALAAQGDNIANITGATSSCVDGSAAAGFNCSKINDGDLATFVANPISNAEMSAAIILDPSIVTTTNISNISVTGRVTGGANFAANLRCLNTSNLKWHNISLMTFTGGTTTYYFNNTHLECLRVNVSSAGNFGDWELNEIVLIQGQAAGPSVTPNLTATVLDAYDSTAIQNFSLAILRTGSVIYNASTGSGTITVNNITNGVATLIFQSNQSGGYLERVYPNVNIAGQSFPARIFQGWIEFIANETITGRQLASFQVTAPLQTNTSYFGGYAGSCIFPTNCSGIATLLLKAGNYNISGNLSSYNGVTYLNTTLNITVLPMSTNRHSLTFGTNRLRVDARSIITGASVQNFTILLYNGSYSTSLTTTTGNASFDILPGTWYMNFSSFTHAAQNASIAIASGNFFPNYTFSIYTTNSINFTILDEQTGLTLSGLGVNIEIISDLYSQNFTTNSSFFYVDLLNPSDYLIRWEAATYDQRTYYFSLTNGSNNQIYLYMLASNLSSQLLQQVIDQDGNNVVDAYIKVYRYFLANNAYSVREIGKTNSDGIAGLNVILNDEFYYFLVQKPLGNTLYTTIPTYIYSTTTDAIQVNIGTSFAQKYFNTIETDYNLSFNPTTSSFRFFWDDPQGLVSEGCLNIYRVGLSQDTLVNSSCDTSSSSTIILRVANVSGATYRAEAFFGFSPADNLISELSYFFPAGNPIGAAGLLFVIFLTLVVFFISIMSGGLAMAVLLTPTPALFASLGGFIDVSASMVIPIQIAAMVVAYVISRR